MHRVSTRDVRLKHRESELPSENSIATHARWHGEPLHEVCTSVLYTASVFQVSWRLSRCRVLACLTRVPIFSSCPNAERHYEDRRNERSRVANKSMEFIDKEMLDRIVRGLQEDLSVLQIKVGALEDLLLKNDEIRAKYTRLVSEEAERLIHQRKSTLE